METLNQKTLRDYTQVLFRHKAVIITSVITVMLTVAAGLMLKTPLYEAEVKMLISASKQVEAPYYRDLTGQQNIGVALTQAEIVKSNPVIERAVRAMGLYELPLDYEQRFCTPLKSIFVKLNAKTMGARLERMQEGQRKAYRYRMALEYLREAVTVEPIRDTNLFFIKVRDFSGYGSAVMANIVSRSYVIFDLEQQLAELRLKYGNMHLAVTQLKDNIDKMEKGLNGEPLPNIEAIGPASVKIIEQAQIPLRPKGIPRALTLILALFMSLFLGVMLAFVFEYADPTFKSPMDAEESLGLPFLGSIPRIKRRENLLLNDAKPRNTRYESFYCTLSEEVNMLRKDRPLKAILFTAAESGEGVSAIAANLGIILSRKAPLRALLVDANLRRPSLDKLFKITSKTGLADVLEGKTALKDAIYEANSRLHILPAGRTDFNPSVLLDSLSMKNLISSLRKDYDLVIIDSAHLKSSKDAQVLAGSVDGVCLVVNERITRRQVLGAALAPLKEKKVNFLGVILNNRTFPVPQFVYDRV